MNGKNQSINAGEAFFGGGAIGQFSNKQSAFKLMSKVSQIKPLNRLNQYPSAKFGASNND